jgi:hypothetical protein
MHCKDLSQRKKFMDLQLKSHQLQGDYIKQYDACELNDLVLNKYYANDVEIWKRKLIGKEHSSIDL